jgi:transcriptional regulator with XRE-family HTH domain
MDQQYDWRLLITEIMDKLLLSRKDIAERLNVTQNTVSCILNGRMNLGKASRPILLKLASQNGIIARPVADVEFKPDPKLWKLKRFLQTVEGRELAQIIKQFSRLSREDRRKFMEQLEGTVQHENN